MLSLLQITLSGFPVQCLVQPSPLPAAALNGQLLIDAKCTTMMHRKGCLRGRGRAGVGVRGVHSASEVPALACNPDLVALFCCNTLPHFVASICCQC